MSALVKVDPPPQPTPWYVERVEGYGVCVYDAEHHLVASHFLQASADLVVAAVNKAAEAAR